MSGPIRVGIIGANPKRGWGLVAHIPALKAMQDFEIAAVSTTRQETADETGAAFGIPRAYGDWRKLVADPTVDVVAICVKVAHHREMVLAAIEAGKHVFCEWPLGLTAADAEEMRQAAKARGVFNMVGLQGRASPYLVAVRDLVSKGAIGDVISATLVSSLSIWGPRLPTAEEYRTKRESGATGLTVPGGHSIDSLCFCLGEFRDVTALVTTQHQQCEIVGTGRTVDVTAPDQVLVSGRLESGAVVSVHVKSDMANPAGVLFEINGTAGDIIVSTRRPIDGLPVGIQRAELTIMLARGRKKEFVEIAELDTTHADLLENVPSGPPIYTARLYAILRDAFLNGGVAKPDFADAVTRHRLLEAIQAASDTGMRQSL